MDSPVTLFRQGGGGGGMKSTRRGMKEGGKQDAYAAREAKET